MSVLATPSIAEFLHRLESDGRLVHAETLPERSARFAELADPLSDSIAGLRPLEGFWSHQAEAIDLARAGRSVVVATGTASGKSKVFQVPIAEAVDRGLRAGTSLLLYPTKALAQDQLRSFAQLGVDRLQAVTYDGDTPRDQRTWARHNANVVLTNPEMLHYGLLPHHAKWATFLKRLEYVVIDELHVLRGIFGTHVAHVLRRLRRMCALYGSDPTFIFCSATIGEPAILAEDLCGKKVEAVTDDGSPCAPRHIALVQPAIVDPERGIRQSPATETIRMVADLVSDDRRVIAFCSSRSLTERVASGVIRALPPELGDTVRSYRSGYLASERREIEDDLAEGRVRAVAATSALELGVDIGGLDATVLCGFPSTIASFWQQIGRAGRGGEESLAVLIAGDDQLDQWFATHPHDLFSRPPEPAVVNIENPNIMDPHLTCAAYELPLRHSDDQWWTELDDGIRRLVIDDELKLRPDPRNVPKAFWAGRGIPFSTISLRSASGGEVRIIDEDGQLIGTVDSGRATSMVHPGAIYLHRGQAWKVLELDLHLRQAIVTRDRSNSWTQVSSSIRIDVTDCGSSKPVGAALLHLGTVKVTTQITGYQVKEVGRREAKETHDLDLPSQELDTTSIWYEWQPSVIAQSGVNELQLPGALHAAEHAAIGILPLFTICDRWDVGGVSIAAAPQSGLPTVFIYDGYPGGAGVAHLAYTASDRHLASTAEVLEACPCTTGCPSCVQSPKCGNGNEPLNKHAALALLRTTLGPADPF